MSSGHEPIASGGMQLCQLWSSGSAFIVDVDVVRSYFLHFAFVFPRHGQPTTLDDPSVWSIMFSDGQ